MLETDELVGHAALVRTREKAGANHADLSTSDAGLGQLKKCSACYAGPFSHTDCDDMIRHHGQCSAAAAGTMSCDFQATAADIAKRIMKLSETTTVADLLPKCPTHNVIVMFNEYLACGPPFADTNWGDMPDWDLAAKALMNLDKHKRKAAASLASEIQTVGVILQFERGALRHTREDGISSGSNRNALGDEAVGTASLSNLPPPPPPADEYRNAGAEAMTEQLGLT